MTRKRRSAITPDETLLIKVIRALEVEVAPADTEWPLPDGVVLALHKGLKALVDDGPLVCTDRDAALPMEGFRVRLELLQFLRSAIRNGAIQQLSTPIGADGWIEFKAGVVDGRVAFLLRAKHQRDLVILQMIHLLQRVGLPNVRECSAPDCPRIYVKVYRREFCSVQCQKRINTRKQRANAKAKRAREAERRRKRRNQGSVANG